MYVTVLPAADVVRVVMGKVAALTLRVLVAVALLNDVIVPELVRLTIPPALFVMPVIEPEPLRLIVPVFVKLASAVVVVPLPVRSSVPALARVVMEHAPLRFSVFDALLVKELDPARVPETVNVVLLVVVPLMVRFGIDTPFVPFIELPVLLKVWTPVFAVKVPSFWRLCEVPVKLTAPVPVSFQIPPLLIVTFPVKLFAPVPPRASVPFTDVVPVTPSVKFDPTVKVVPAPTAKIPPTTRFAPVVAVAVPLSVRFPLIVVIAPKVSAPPLKVR